MGGEITKAKGRERGPWFEIQCTREIIISKEAKGQDASFERALLRAWAECPGYESAKEAIPALVRKLK